MALDLPAEVLSQIFTLAADDDLIFQYALPTSLANSSWDEDEEDWYLRTPQDAANALMRRSCATKMALMLTCKQWYSVAQEHLFRCLYFDTPFDAIGFADSLEDRRDATMGEGTHLGWWTRRLHVYRDPDLELEDEELGPILKDMHEALIRIIEYCPNLEIFHVDWPLRGAFGDIAAALSERCKRSLRTVHFNVPRNAVSKVILALHSFKFIVAAHIEFEPGSSPSCNREHEDDERTVNVGCASSYELNLQYLYQLSISGHAREFLDRASQGFLPSLKIFSYSTGLYTGAVPDAILTFLQFHGDTLEFVDLDTNLPLDIASILDVCPHLSTFAFNADCRIDLLNASESKVVNRPKPNITTIGLHGLGLAFGVGPAVSKNETSVIIIQKTNDSIMAALNKRNFPNLQRVRALSPTMLMDLNDAGQPSEALNGMARWTKWWDTCAAASISLEDCTGTSLGNLPSPLDYGEANGQGEGEGEGEGGESDEYEDGEDGEDDYDDYDDDDGDEVDDDDDDEDDDEDESSDSDEEHILPSGWKKKYVPPMPEEEPSARTQELRDLLKECRAMDRARIREAPLLPPSFMMMMGGGMGFPGAGMMPGFSGPDIPTAVGAMGFGFGASR